MARFVFIVLLAAVMGGVILAFNPHRMSGVAWVVLGVAVIYGLFSAVLPERMLRRRLNRREPLSFNEIYRTSFQQLPYPRAVIEEAWNEVASDLQLDARKIRPADRFREELSVKTFPLVDVSEAVESRLRERLRKAETKADLSQLKTVGDCVEFFCKLELAKHPA